MVLYRFYIIKQRCWAANAFRERFGSRDLVSEAETMVLYRFDIVKQRFWTANAFRECVGSRDLGSERTISA